jgi:hypothetical protein
LELNKQNAERESLWSMKSLISPAVQTTQKAPPATALDPGSSQFAQFLQKFVENGQGGGSPVQSFKSKL